jgi:hypothetical protein
MDLVLFADNDVCKNGKETTKWKVIKALSYLKHSSKPRYGALVLLFVHDVAIAIVACVCREGVNGMIGL